MQPGWIGSVICHALMLAATFLAWPRDAPDLPPPSSVVPVEIIDKITDVTNVSAVAPEPAELPPDEEVAPAGSQQTMAPPEPDAPEAVADPRQKQKKKQETPRRTVTDISNIQRMIDLEKKQQGGPGSTTPAPTGPRPRPSLGAGTEMTASESDAIYAHLTRCWRAPADSPDPQRLVVKVRILLNADGSLAGAPELVSPRSVAGADSALRNAAENAVRAVQVCDPFPVAPNRTQRLPAVLNFDPRLMAGAN